MTYRYTIYKPFCPVREQVEFSDSSKLELYLGAIPKDCVCKIEKKVQLIKRDNQHWLFPDEAENELWEQIALLKW